MFVGVLPQQVHWRDPNLVITIPMIMTALKSSGLFQFALFTVIVITFKFSLQALFTMPEHWTPLYGSTYSIATHNSYCDIYFSFFLLFFSNLMNNLHWTLRLLPAESWTRWYERIQWFWAWITTCTNFTLFLLDELLRRCKPTAFMLIIVVFP